MMSAKEVLNPDAQADLDSLDSPERDDNENEPFSLKARAFVALSIMGLTPLTAAMFLTDSVLLVVSLMTLGLGSVLISAHLLSRWLVEPIYELRARLVIKRHEQDSGAISSLGFDTQSIAEYSPATAVKILGYHKNSDTSIFSRRLPLELNEIEKIATRISTSDASLDSLKKDLMRHLAHQLKSPMSQLIALAHTSRRSLAKQDYDDVNDRLKDVEEVCMSVGGLVEHMLSMAWADDIRRKGLNDENRVHISSVIMNLSRTRQVSAEAKGLVIETDVEAGIWVKGDRGLLHEMITAIVDNAIRYSPDNGGPIRIQAECVEDDIATIDISDCGPGIPENERSNVFEPFYGVIERDKNGSQKFGTRQHRALSGEDVKLSHGLGLSLVSSVAKLHGATISLHDNDLAPSGVRFHIEIPLSLSTVDDSVF